VNILESNTGEVDGRPLPCKSLRDSLLMNLKAPNPYEVSGGEDLDLVTNLDRTGVSSSCHDRPKARNWEGPVNRLLSM